MSGKRSFLFFIFTILYVAVAITAVLRFFPDSIWLIAICLILALAVYGGLLKIIDAFFLNKITHYLDEECDPITYLTEYKKYYGLLSGQTSEPIHLLYEYHGLMALGKTDEAGGILDRIQQKKTNANDYFYPYYFARTTLEIELGNSKAAQYYLNTLEQPLNNTKPLIFRRKNFLLLKELVLFSHADILRINDDLLESKKIYESFLLKDLPKSMKTANLYYLGLIEIKLGNNKTAKEYLMKALQDGNKLFFVEDARQKLSELERFEYAV